MSLTTASAGGLVSGMHLFVDVLVVLCLFRFVCLCFPLFLSLCLLFFWLMRLGVCLNWTGSSLFNSVIAKVPFVDVLSSMTNPSLPLTKHEYDEWGNPQSPQIYNYIRSYGPLLSLLI